MVYLYLRTIHFFYDFLESLIFSIVLALFPTRLNYKMGRIMGRVKYVLDLPFVFKIPGYMEFFKIPMVNRKKLLQNLYINWALFKMESFFIIFKPIASLEKISQFIEVEGIDLLKNHQKFILTTAYFGTPFMFLIWAVFRYPTDKPLILNIVKMKKDNFLDFLVSRKLSQRNIQIRFIYIDKSRVSRIESAKQMMKAAQNNELIVTLFDVDSYSKVEVDFLGRKNEFSLGVAHLAKKYDYPIFPFFARRGKNKVIISVCSSIDSKNFDGDQIIQILASHLENAIRSFPDQWYVWPTLWREKLS